MERSELLTESSYLMFLDKTLGQNNEFTVPLISLEYCLILNREGLGPGL